MRSLAAWSLVPALLAAPCPLGSAQSVGGACPPLVPRQELRHTGGLYERVGEALDRDGGWLVVGAPNQLSTKQPAVLIHSFDEDWTLEQELQGTGGGFGGSVAVAGETLLVGAPEAGVQVPFDQVEASAYDTGSGVLYGIDAATDVLVVIDTASGLATARGPVAFGHVAGLGFDPTAGRLLGSDLETGLLVSIDPLDGAAVAVGPLGFARVEALARDPESGALLGVDTATDQLVSIDATSGAATAVGAIGFGDVVGLTWHEPPGAPGGLLGWDRASSALVAIDAAPGAGTLVASVPPKEARTLAWAPGAALCTVNLLQDNLLRVDPSAGTTALVGPLGPSLYQAGEVHVYERLGSGPASWGPVATLVAEHPQAAASFGAALDLDGDTAAIVAGAGSGVPLGAAVHVFERDHGGPDAWGRTDSLYAPEGASVGAVCLDGDRLAACVGGELVLYAREVPGGPWTEVERLVGPYGSLVGPIAIDGMRIAVGADDDTPVTNAGAVDVYVRSLGGTHVHEAHLTAPLAQANGRFGSALALDDPWLFAASAEYAGDGYVAAYERNGATWSERWLEHVPHPWQLSDDFGSALHAEGGTLIVGAPGHRHQALPGRGAVFTYELNELPAASIEAYCTAGTSAAGCRATLCAWGQPSASASAGFHVEASGAPGTKNGLYYFGTAGRQAQTWGGGSSFQCVVPPLRRGPLLSGQGTEGFCDGWFTQDLNAFWCGGCPGQAKNPGAGTTCQLQLWYRDPGNATTTGTSLSNALEFTLAP